MPIGKQAKILTDKQQHIILSHFDTTRYPLRNKIIFLLSFKAGLRAKEIANLTWSMICDSDGNISNELNLTNKACKGQHSGRIIPMHAELKKLLITYLNNAKENNRFNLQNKIIFSERSRYVSAQTIVNFFQNLYKIVGFEGCSSHSGRRTFITNAAKIIGQTGGTLNDVKLLAGHSSLTTTQRYIEYNTDAQRKIVEMI